MTTSESTTGRGTFDVDVATSAIHMDETYARALGLGGAGKNLRRPGEKGSGRLRVTHRTRDGAHRDVQVYTTHLVVEGHGLDLAQTVDLTPEGANGPEPAEASWSIAGDVLGGRVLGGPGRE